MQQKELSDCYISVRPTNVKMSVSVQSAFNVKMSVSVQSAFNVKMSVSVQSAFNREESVRSIILQVSNEKIPARCVSKAVSFYLNLLLGSTGGAR